MHHPKPTATALAASLEVNEYPNLDQLQFGNADIEASSSSIEFPAALPDGMTSIGHQTAERA